MKAFDNQGKLQRQEGMEGNERRAKCESASRGVTGDGMAHRNVETGPEACKSQDYAREACG